MEERNKDNDLSIQKAKGNNFICQERLKQLKNYNCHLKFQVC